MRSSRVFRYTRVTMTEASGATRAATSDNFGRHRFDDVAAGQTVVISVQPRRSQSSPISQIFNLTENLSDANFIVQDDNFPSP